MIYTPMTKKAMVLAYEAHQNQVDRSGVPYIFHPFHLAEMMQTETEVCVALLHDVLEDTSYTLNDLTNEGFSEEVLEAVVLLTREPQIPYMDYVRRLKSNPIARKVKLADLAHNSDETRLSKDDTGYLKLKCRYEKAKAFLEADD
jgi:(p)ppGpp synthase/HD superfamily hydrolase